MSEKAALEKQSFSKVRRPDSGRNQEKEGQGMRIEEQIQDLIQKPQCYWNAYAFSREILNQKIPKEEQSRLSDLAADCGREEAKRTAAEFPGMTPAEICRELGIRVMYDPSENGGYPLIVAAFREPDEIRLSQDALRRMKIWMNRDRKLQQELQAMLFSEWKPEEILLAHELFHYIESKAGNLPVSTARIRLKLGPFSYQGKVQILSEIAGMAFAQELLQLSYCPFVLDCVFLWVYNMLGESIG